MKLSWVIWSLKILDEMQFHKLNGTVILRGQGQGVSRSSINQDWLLDLSRDNILVSRRKGRTCGRQGLIEGNLGGVEGSLVTRDPLVS